MVWFVIGHLFSTLLDWCSIGRLSVQEKDVEILLLRQQLAILQRKLAQPIRPSRIEKLTMAVLVVKLKAMRKQPMSNSKRSFGCSNPKQCSSGIASWYDANGLFVKAVEADGPGVALKSKR